MGAVIRPLDWQRMLLGEDPAAFLIEVLLRTAVVYAFLIVVVRLLGKRMSGQLSNLELAVMLALGAIISPSIEISKRGVLAAVVLLSTLLLLQRAISAAAARSARVERVLFGRGSSLIQDGRLLLPAMRSAMISHEQLFATLRSQGVRQLGEVKRVYLEACGRFSVLKQVPAHPGLSIVPRQDAALARTLPHASSRVCERCGYLEQERPTRPCPHCGCMAWVPAVSADEAHEQTRPEREVVASTARAAGQRR
jgi:uncharacterized membrane protein YcaP (DUF421 family)